MRGTARFTPEDVEVGHRDILVVMTAIRQQFRGRIAGVGSTSGTRVVVGRWEDTPLGTFGDAMVETASGHRVLLAPHQDAADFIAATYTFDEVRIEPFAVTDPWQVRSPSLTLDLSIDARTPLGRALRAVPRPVAVSPAWCTFTDPIARVVMRGVRTRGTAGNGRVEYYGARRSRRIGAATGTVRRDGLDGCV